MEAILTDHAIERADERLGWNREILLKMSQKALEKGLNHCDTKSKLNKYITKLWFQYKTANNVKIYGENLFLFKGNILITLYRLPNELIKYVKLKK